ncbi:MAG: AMP-binding protein, partial [Burkholderiaceae bacterium]|nr:AMP-binding protein [Burkholderiaceae bacterium]
MNHSALGQTRVGDIIDYAAMLHPHKEALLCAPTGRRFTFAQTCERANRLANALLGLGLRKGQCVAFLSTNRAEVVEIYFALAKSGLVGMPLNYRLAPVEMIALMREVD